METQIVNMTLEVFGDPWLDNTIFFPDGTQNNQNDSPFVSIRDSYFQVIVYRADGELSILLSGIYLCLKGCSHKINGPDYTTTLTLFKVPGGMLK
jgi:hypothetical protein